MTENRTLEVRVQPTEVVREEALEKVRRLEDGDEVEDMHVLNLSTERELSRLMSEKNLELLHTVAEREPSSIRELSRMVDRDYREVHRNMEELESLNVVGFVEEGRSKRPVIWYDNIEVNVDLSKSA